MKLCIEHIQYHRNGISGAPFHVLTFRDPDEGRMVGVVFEEPYHVAVFNLDKLAVGNIAFSVNSWRGDRYEPFLRTAIGGWSEEGGSILHPTAKNDHGALRIDRMLTGCQDWESKRDGLIELLTDARHWCDQHGEDFASLDRLAYARYLEDLHSKRGGKP